MAAPRDTISNAIRQAAARGRPAVVGFMTAGFPDRAGFRASLAAIATAADVVEIGIPTAVAPKIAVVAPTFAASPELA